MMGHNVKTSSRTAAREAFFLDFATETRKRFPHLLLMLTGGIRSRQGAEAVLSDGACDLVGIGRPACVNPSFPKLLLDVEGTPDEEAQLPLAKAPLPGWAKLIPLKILGAGAESVSFYPLQMYRTSLFFPPNLFVVYADILRRPDLPIGQGSRDLRTKGVI